MATVSGAGPRPMKRVDPTSPVPYYVQICEFMRARILAGEWPWGSQIPTEINARVSCKKGSRRVSFTYQQNL